MKRLVEVLLILVVAALPIFAGGGSEKQPGTAPAAAQEVAGKVTIWFDSGAAWNQAIQQTNANMKAKFPKIEPEWVAQDTQQLSAKLITAFVAKNPPDVTFSQQARLVSVENQFQGWADLKSIAARDPGMQSIIDNLPKEQVEAYMRGAKLWGLPEVIQKAFLFIRKSWMEGVNGSVPKDWNEFTELAKKLTKGDKYGYGIFGAPGTSNGAGTQFFYLASAAGLQYPIIDAQGKPTFDDPIAVETAKWMKRWMFTDKILSPGTPSWTHKEFYEAVQAGQLGMGRVGAWNIGPWEKSAMGKDYVITTFPPMKKDQRNKAYQGSWNNGIVLSGLSKDKKTAVEAFKFLISKETQEVFFPVRTSWSRNDLDFAKLMGADARYKPYTDPAIPLSAEQAHVDTWLPVLDILAKNLNYMLSFPEADPEKVMRTAYDEAMAKYKEMKK
jgi:ABC-type glycerol-3-phosphate transport system substrate-binding protein